MDSKGWIKVHFNVSNTGSWMEPPKVERAINEPVWIEWTMLNTRSCGAAKKVERAINGPISI
ncbi:uncharacterized protein G2W53_042052 [Senna tora]|uniref:Uncharacterized protein n=1 Tax=Senna tora TaxID=362788 RepID=A0A834W210_9FABA|nr:uncharacterized protein G2W53_042052 [Senna tora]